MSMNFEDTQRIKTTGKSTEPNSNQQNPLDDTQALAVKKPKRWRVILLGILLILIFGAGGGGFGYLNGIRQRVDKQNEEILTQAAIQYQYGVQQMANGNYELARTHLEYVLSIYPEFPGITEKYTEVMIELAKASQPTALPSPTPTVDTRGAEALFNQAVQEVQSQQWEAAMNTLEALRNEDYTYRTLEVDGLYFIVLRYRAIEMIVKNGDLEEGLYLLALSEQFAPLDRDAVNYANWARMYLTGVSFWEVNWEQVVSFFSQLYAAFPYMHDGTGWTATDRFIIASEKYGDQLVATGAPCDALEYYQNVLNINPQEHVQDKYNQAYLQCYPPTPTPEPLPTQTPLPDNVPTEESQPDS